MRIHRGQVEPLLPFPFGPALGIIPSGAKVALLPMTKILAIETSDAVASVAAAEDVRILRELELPSDGRSAQTLSPAMSDLLRQVGWRPNDVELVAVSIGPGSFTGLRVGVTAAKVFAYATGADVIGVNTLEALAAAAPGTAKLIAAAVDAQRGDVAAQSFLRGTDGVIISQGPMRVVPCERWTNELIAGTIVVGPIVPKRLIGAGLPLGVEVAPPECHRPSAGRVAMVAAHYAQQGRRDDPWALLPVYSRLSAAEERWTARVADPQRTGADNPTC